MCFAYVPPQDSVYCKSHNVGYFEQLERSIRKYSHLGKIAVIGDINARCGTRSDTLRDSYIFEKYIRNIDNTDYTLPHSVIPERYSMDSTCNSSGLKLLDICLSTDIKIVNGRFGDDAGVGNFTFMSQLGESLIDYALMSQDLFSLIDNFIVHDFYSCSTMLLYS